jgi:4-aminobutyrate aminotransferase-like enzyme
MVAPKKEPPLKVRVSKRTWYRGQGCAKSFLRLPDSSQQCCIGFFARALGAKVSEIQMKSTLDIVDHEACQNVGHIYESVLSDCYEVNDDENLTDTQRMKQLKELGMQMNVKFIFVP